MYKGETGIKGFSKGHKQVREDILFLTEVVFQQQSLSASLGGRQEFPTPDIFHLHLFFRLTHDEIISPCGSMGILPLI